MEMAALRTAECGGTEELWQMAMIGVLCGHTRFPIKETACETVGMAGCKCQLDTTVQRAKVQPFPLSPPGAMQSGVAWQVTELPVPMPQLKQRDSSVPSCLFLKDKLLG